MSNLKLFVWEGVLADYTDGIMFALAENIEDAKKQISLKADSSFVDLELESNYKVYDSPIGFYLFGGG